MAAGNDGMTQLTSTPARGVERFDFPADIPASLIGQAAAWFRLSRRDRTISVEPQQPLPRRCTIRPAALFQHERGFPDVNTVMGRLNFASGSADPQPFRPYTEDPHRQAMGLFFPVEAMPDDDWPTSPHRWSNHQAIARHLLTSTGIPWTGLTNRDIAELVEFVPWPEPLEGCVLHALTQWRHETGKCVIEIGSLRGRSLAMLAMALRGVGSESLLLSIDPHAEHRSNADQLRVTLRQIGEENRLTQIQCGSDQACHILAPRSASLIFVDGDHSYRQVLADFQNYRDLLAPGGCIAFHDYGYGNHNGQPEADPDVRRAVDEHVFTDATFSPLLLAHTLMAFVKEA